MELTIAVVLIMLAFCAGAGVSFVVFRARAARDRSEIESQVAAEIARMDERLRSREERVVELSEQLRTQDGETDRLRDELRSLESQGVELATRLEEERRSAAEKLAAFEETKISLLDTFKALSADALRTNNQSFLDLAMQNLSKFQEGAKGEMEKRAQAIDELVRPLKESLLKVDEKIDLLEKSRTSAYVSLHEQVKFLSDTQQQLRNETGNLVKALRAPAVRGRWGEIQLRRVVELAGMVDHCDFFEQETVDTEEGRRRPDMVIKLPNGRDIAVDAKVPIEAYLRAIESQDDELRLFHLRDHARQIRDHVNKLSQKTYWQLVQSPEFTVLFLSGEMFFGAALEQDPGLLEFGADRKVIVATPTTLIALLRAVYYGWREEALAEHARAIQELGAQLHDRLRVATGHLLKVRKGLDNAVLSYNDFVRSFDNRVLVSARKFKELEAASGEEIPEIEVIVTSPVVSAATASALVDAEAARVEELLVIEAPDGESPPEPEALPPANGSR